MATLIDIWCHLIDHKKEPIGTLFKLKISSDADVNDLRDKVKETLSPTLDSIAVNELVVWKCLDSTITFDDEDPKKLKDQVSKAFFNQKLRILGMRRTIADLKLSKGEILFVQRPEPTVSNASKRKKHDEINTPSKHMKTYEEEQDENVEAAKKAPPPSQAASPTQFAHIQQGLGKILNGRPADCVGPPIGLYHPVFDEFKEKLKGDGEISLDARKLVQEFVTASASFYKLEDDRMEGIQHILGDLIGGPLEKVRSNGVESDGVLLVSANEWSAKVVICEVKNEIGTGKVDPYTQACLAYQRYCSDVINNRLRQISYCPCIILAIAGPWFCVAGAVFSRTPIVQPLTGYEWTAPECLLGDQSRLERIFHSLKAATYSLQTYYKTLPLVKDIPAAERVQGFPYISSYDGNPFSYVERLGGDDEMKQVFKVNEGGCLRVVKFTTQYNEAAHRLLSEKIKGESFAPALYHVSQRTFGGRRMVVMDYVDGESAFSRTLTEGHFGQLRDALDRLHTKGLVFGDLRKPNIMLAKERVMLIDFDWCGFDGKTNYPIDLNTKVKWATGAGPGEVMRKNHDDEMLEMLQKLQPAEIV